MSALAAWEALCVSSATFSQLGSRSAAARRRACERGSRARRRAGRGGAGRRGRRGRRRGRRRRGRQRVRRRRLAQRQRVQGVRRRGAGGGGGGGRERGCGGRQQLRRERGRRICRRRGGRRGGGAGRSPGRSRITLCDMLSSWLCMSALVIACRRRRRAGPAVGPGCGELAALAAALTRVRLGGAASACLQRPPSG